MLRGCGLLAYWENSEAKGNYGFYKGFGNNASYYYLQNLIIPHPDPPIWEYSQWLLITEKFFRL